MILHAADGEIALDHPDSKLLIRLASARVEHDRSIVLARSGVGQAALDGDVERWIALGDAVAHLARLVGRHCAASAFCDARPGAEPLAARLIESIDDLIDPPAWIVIEAASRLKAAEII